MACEFMFLIIQLSDEEPMSLYFPGISQNFPKQAYYGIPLDWDPLLIDLECNIKLEKEFQNI